MATGQGILPSASASWPTIEGDSVVFANQMGVYAATSFSAPALWRWDAGASLWTTDGLTLPLTSAPSYSLSLAGVDGGLLFLFAGAADRSPEDQLFWQTWLARPTSSPSTRSSSTHE